MSKQLTIPSLGRNFTLGMLYDCRHETPIAGITLWDNERLRQHSEKVDMKTSKFDMIAEDTIKAKSSVLHLEAEVKLSFMGGLVQLEGAAKYLNDKKTSQKQSRVTLQYTSTSHFEQLTMDQIGNVQYPDVFEHKDATHVVTGITYGADAFFIFDRLVSDEETMTEVHGNMEVAMKSLQISGGASFDAEAAEKAGSDKFVCKFHGDMHLKSNPSTFNEAIQLYRDLPQQLDKSVPKTIVLSPLSELEKLQKKKTKDLWTELFAQYHPISFSALKVLWNIFTIEKCVLTTFWQAMCAQNSMTLKLKFPKLVNCLIASRQALLKNSNLLYPRFVARKQN